MTCKYHKDREAENKCIKCGANLCSECSVNINGKILCKECISKAVFKDSEQKVSGKRSMFWCLVFSMIPGGGHLFMGVRNRGLVYLILIILLFGLQYVIPGAGPTEITITLIWFYSVIDSISLCYMMNKGKKIDDIDLPELRELPRKVLSRKDIVGGILVILGILGIINRAEYYAEAFIREYFEVHMYYGFGRFALSIMLLIIGICLISKSKKQKKKSNSANFNE